MQPQWVSPACTSWTWCVPFLSYFHKLWLFLHMAVVSLISRQACAETCLLQAS